MLKKQPRLGWKLHRLDLLMQLYLRSNGDDVIPPAQMRMLEFIASHPGCTQADVAEEMQVSPASVAQSIKRIEASGYVSRAACKGNLRANSLEITPSGIDAAALCRKVFDGLQDRMLLGFSADEREALDSMITRLMSNLESGDTGSMNNMELSLLVKADGEKRK
ncbi:MAG: MarR family transcriptional regulator [Clostridia bacterium]|nr:MarR family transcriptional regulator [Clostridia bacterium]